MRRKARSIQFTDAEWRRVQKAAQVMAMSASAYVRVVSLRQAAHDQKRGPRAR